MSTEKTEALVIRQADFSESSRVVTFFTRDFGKIACLAKGAKRLRNAFDGALDVLAESRIVFILKSSGSLDLLTEAELTRRFQPLARSLPHLYAGYYVAELLDALTEVHDPHPELFSAAHGVLLELADAESVLWPVTRFEFAALREVGQLPDFDTCMICQSEIKIGDRARFWVRQSGLICSDCGDSDYEATELQPQTLELLRRLASSENETPPITQLEVRQKKELRRVATSAIAHVLGRPPKTSALIAW